MKHDLALNHYALILCITHNYKPEEALERMGIHYKPQVKTNAEKAKQTLEMVHMREQGMSLRQIAEHFGLSDTAVLYRIRVFERRRT
jgi:transposase